MVRLLKQLNGKNLIKLCKDNWVSMCKRMNLEIYLILYTKMNSNWIKDLNVQTKALTFSEDRNGKKTKKKFFSEENIM